MLKKFTPVSLTVMLTLQVWTPMALAETLPACDAHTLNQLLRADEPSPLQQFVEQCGDSIADVRGFTVYDRARLLGSHAITSALVKQGQYSESNYSNAMGKLIQTGLRFLNFDAGIIDGKISSRGIEAIKRYQKRYGFKVDGQLHDDWLADFHRRLVKQTQLELTDLGFNTGSADGIIGPNTMTAMQAFRQERQIAHVDYREVDDQLLYQLMMMRHEKNKQAIAKRNAERTARRVAQEAARRREVARAREEERRQAEAKHRAAEAAAKAAREQRQVEEQRVVSLDLAEKQHTVDVMQAAGQQEVGQDIQASSTMSDEQQSRRQAEEAVRQAQIEAERARIAQEKAAAEQAAARKRAQEIAAEQAAANAKAAEEKARREAAEAAQAADQARSEAHRAFNAAKHNKTLTLTPEMSQATAIQGVKSLDENFNQLAGELQYQGSASLCTVAGQPMEASWCESYYESSKGKRCTAVLDKAGVKTFSFLCESK